MVQLQCVTDGCVPVAGGGQSFAVFSFNYRSNTSLFSSGPRFLVFYSFIDPPKCSNPRVTFPLTQSWLRFCYIYFLYIVYPTETPAGS